MSTLIQINVTNNSPTAKSFFFFQQPAVYTGGVEPYSNSLLGTEIAANDGSGSVYSFQLLQQFYAGVQQQHSMPVIGEPSGYSSAIQPIDLTPAAGGTPTNNMTIMANSPLGLSVPTDDADVQAGAFRISTPTYDATLAQFNGGTAVQLATGAIVLSNFVTVDPTTNLDCQPVLQFYVATGDYTAGTVINFTSSSSVSALCNATTGYTNFDVSYNADGTWSVISSVAS